jgi:hypothetical protein
LRGIGGWFFLQKDGFSKHLKQLCGPWFVLWTQAASLCQWNQLWGSLDHWKRGEMPANALGAIV